MKEILVVLIIAFALMGGAALYRAMKAPKAPIKIGVVLSLSGEFEIYGTMGVNGAKIAVAEINQRGGVLGGRPLKLIIEDDQTDSTIAVAKTRTLIQEDGVIAIVGSVSSAARDAMNKVTLEFKTPQLYGIDYEGGVYNRYLFCYSMIPDHYVKPLVPYLAETYGKSFYVFGYDYIWPRVMSVAIRKAVQAIGGDTVGVEFTPFGVTDFSKTLQQIRESGANVLMLILPGVDGFRFLKQASDAGLKENVKIVAMAADESYLRALDSKSLEGVLTAVHFLASLERDDTRRFVAKYEKMFGKKTPVTFSTEAHYGLIKLLANAIDKAGTDDKEKIIDAMENEISIVVGTGPVRVRKDHHLNLNIVLAEYTNGNLIEKKNMGLIVPEDQRYVRRETQ